LLANQLRQAGAVESLQLPASARSNNDQQQLALFLQQQLWGMGLASATNPALAQSIGINLQAGITSNANTGSHNTNPSFPPSNSQGFLGTNPASSLFAAQNATGFANSISNAQSIGTNIGMNNPNAATDLASLINQARDIVSAAVNRPGSETARLHDNNQQQETVNELTGRPSIQLYLTCDDDSLSEYQCLVRKQIELFEAVVEDVESNAQGRNRPIVLGQVGIRCCHCSMLPPKHRARGAIYYPAKLQGIYQAAQNLAAAHLGVHCQNVPANIRNHLTKLRERKSSAGGGKKYWADGVRVLGVFEGRDGLRFEKSVHRQNQVN
jgi:hypothetical protein